MKRQSRKGFTLIELLVVVAIIALLIAILIPSLGRAKELANRSACGASLTGILKAANLYSASNNDQFPVVFNGTALKYTSPSSTGGANGVAGSAGNATVAIAGYFNASTFAAGDPMACLWILVLSGNVSPKQFVCKSDPASPTVSDQTDSTGLYYYTFGETQGNAIAEAYSYSIAYPWTGGGAQGTGTNPVGAYWRSTVDSSLPIASDMAPLNNSGSNPTKNVTTSKGGLNAPKVYNSQNHTGGEGQNIAFADTHVEFTTSPYVGQSGDNIWTTGTSGAQSIISAQKTIPAEPTNSNPFDLVFVPVRNATANTQ